MEDEDLDIALKLAQCDIYERRLREQVQNFDFINYTWSHFVFYILNWMKWKFWNSLGDKNRCYKLCGCCHINISFYCCWLLIVQLLNFKLAAGASKTSRSRLSAGGQILSRESDRSDRVRREGFSSENLQSSQGRQERRRTQEGVDRSPEKFQPVPNCSRVPPG